MENFKISLRQITEDNFMEAFNLKLANGQGYGSIALDLVIEYIKTKPFGASDKVTLTCNMDNIHALNLYKNKGFKETGTMDEDEIELSLIL